MSDYNNWSTERLTLSQVIHVSQTHRNIIKRLRAPFGKHRKFKSDIIVNRKRHAKKLKRSLYNKYKKKKLLRGLESEELVAKFSHNKLLDAIFPKRSKLWKNPVQRTFIEPINLDNFSILDNPVGVCRDLKKLAYAEAFGFRVRINFNDEDCHDIGSYLLLEEMWRGVGPFFPGGKIGKNARRVLDAVSLSERFNMAPNEIVWTAENENDDFAIIPLSHRRQERKEQAQLTSGIEPTRTEILSTEVIEFIEHAFEQVKLLFKEDARSNLHSLITEVLDNAETHSRENKTGGYTISGFLTQTREGNDNHRFKLHLGFLSMGDSIAESIQRAPEQLQERMQRYVRRHSRRSNFSEENLYTVYAFQDGITRLEEKLNVHDGKSIGGTGLCDIISMFGVLALAQRSSSPPKLAILSGSTYLSLQSTGNQVLQLVKSVSEDDLTSARRIWFNIENSEMYPPEDGSVITLPQRIPGTLVTMALDLDPDLLRKAE